MKRHFSMFLFQILFWWVTTTSSAMTRETTPETRTITSTTSTVTTFVTSNEWSICYSTLGNAVAVAVVFIFKAVFSILMGGVDSITILSSKGVAPNSFWQIDHPPSRHTKESPWVSFILIDSRPCWALLQILFTSPFHQNKTKLCEGAIYDFMTFQLVMLM